MNDEEFKKKLESILGNLYQIDREAMEAIEREKAQQKKQGHMTQSPQVGGNQKRTENHNK
jgi:hypothetical protein